MRPNWRERCGLIIERLIYQVVETAYTQTEDMGLAVRQAGAEFQELLWIQAPLSVKWK